MGSSFWFEGTAEPEKNFHAKALSAQRNGDTRQVTGVTASMKGSSGSIASRRLAYLIPPNDDETAVVFERVTAN
jgi:hypothetical protein